MVELNPTSQISPSTLLGVKVFAEILVRMLIGAGEHLGPGIGVVEFLAD